jgi:hypothetical protein
LCWDLGLRTRVSLSPCGRLSHGSVLLPCTVSLSFRTCTGMRLGWERRPSPGRSLFHSRITRQTAVTKSCPAHAIFPNLLGHLRQARV